MSRLPILLLCAFVLSCKSTKTATSSNESERGAAVQAQWRSAQNLSFSGLQRLTALSFDSCVFTFGGPDEPAAPQCSAAISPSGKPQKNSKAKPSITSKATPSPFIFQSSNSSSFKATPSKTTIYGLHLSHAVEEKSSVYQREADSLTKAMQSSYDKSQSSTKSRTSVPFTAKLAIAVIFILMAAAIIFLFRRIRSAKRIKFGSRLPHQSTDGSGGALFGSEDKPLCG